MAFLIEQIKEQKILEMEVNLDDFLKENAISETAMIQTMLFDKEVFKEETEVRDYVKSHYLTWEPQVEEREDDFIVVLFSKEQIDVSSEIIVELRRGVTAFSYDLKPVVNTQEIAFNSKGAKSFVSKIDTIDFSNGLPHIIEIAKVANGYHPRYGNIEVTTDHLKSFVKNFDAKVTDVDLAVNEDHEKKEAFGWYKDVWLSQDGTTLYGSIQWNTKGTSALSEKDYRYFSPEFHFNYIHELTGEEHGPTLLGGALTNYPFLKMNAIIELNNKNTLTKEEVVTKETQIDLSVHNQTVVELNGKVSSLEVDLNAKISENETLNTELNTLKETIALNAKKQAHEKLFLEGHITEAQKKTLDDGGTMLEVLALNAKMNTKPAGTIVETTEVVELNATEKSLAEKMGLSEDEFKAVQL